MVILYVKSERTQVMGAMHRIAVIVFCVLSLLQTRAQALIEQEFTPVVTATCKAGFMTIRIHTNQTFQGAVQARDFRSTNCMTYGNGTHDVMLGINLLANHGASDYCGVLVNNRTEERSVPIAVRIHRTLELADDKFYVITCGKAGFKNANNQTSLVSLKLINKTAGSKRVHEAIYSHAYTIRADISRPDGTYGIRVKSCFAFNKSNNSVPLIDERGCPVNNQVISPFKFDEKTGAADATLYSMFRFPDTSEVHFQCDVAVCRGPCVEASCAGQDVQPAAQARALTKDIDTSSADEGVLMASTSVFVLDPGSFPVVEELCDSGVHPAWLLWLCVALAVLFIIMLVINVFLCSAMTCSCARTEIIEKDPSIIEEYDPYRSWHGSQYGSRYSLNGKPGYASGGSTIHSTRSMSTNSDHYAIVHSRPGSRYSANNKQQANTLGRH